MIKVLREIDKNGKYVSRDGILYSIRFVKNDETLKSYEEENALEIEDLNFYGKIFDIWNIRPITKEEETLEIYKSNPLYSSEYEYYDKDGNLIFYSSVPKDCYHRYNKNTYIKSGDIRCEVTSGISMFYDCINLIKLNFIDLSSLTSGYSMFRGCLSLNKIYYNNLKSLTDGRDMFYDCKELLEIDINDSPLLSTSSNMFRNCLKLKKITISKTESLSGASDMFSGCSSLTEISLGDLSSLTNGVNMFYSCSSLIELTLNGLQKLNIATYMFRICTKLHKLTLGNVNLLTNGAYMFQYCSNLTDLTITNLDSLTNGQYMFYECRNLSLESCQMIANLLPDRSGDTSGTEYPLGVQNVANWNDELTQICTNKGWTVYE